MTDPGDVKAAERFVAAVIDAVGFLRMPIEKPRSLLGDGVLTAGGFAILYGQPGTGKTWHALALARSWVRGEPWMGLAVPPESLRVGFLELELGGHAMQQRLRALGIGRPEDARLQLVARPFLSGVVDLFARQADVAALRHWIRSEGLGVLVLDALSRAHTADESSAQEFGQVLAQLDALRHETGCALVLVHHERKVQRNGADENDLDALRGTSRLQSDPTLLVRVVSMRGLRSLRFVKVSEGPTPAPIYFELGEDGHPRATPSPEAVGAGNRAKLERAVLEAGRPLSCNELARLVGLTDSPTRQHLAALTAEGRVCRLGDGKGTRYSAPTSRLAACAACDGVQAGQLTLSDNEL